MENKVKLNVSDALELRNEYDMHLSVLKDVLGKDDEYRSFLSRHSEVDKKEYDDAVDIKEIEKIYKTLESKRVKLNQEIQSANFLTKVTFKGEDIPIIEVLEVRKQLKGQIKQTSSQLMKSTYKEVVHKEERDIVYRPKKEFPGVYKEYTDLLKHFREIQMLIHEANSKTIVNF
ncbi:MAG: hypothetical protein PF693_09040, partial [Spirochaetia bacterium]|nr:hypothetical protein [Spirochaetia bacterium]